MYERLLRRSGSVSKPATIAGPSGGRRTSIRPSPTRQRAAGAPSALGNAAAPETTRRARIGARFVRAFAAVSLLLLGTLAIALPAQSQTVPSAPQELTAEASAGRIDLSWSAPADDGGSDIQRYEIRYAKGATVPENANWIPVGPGTASALTGLSNSEPYTFVVRAVNGEGAGDVARTQATPGSPPTAPQDLSAAPDDTQVVLSWSAPADNYSSDIVRYEVRHVAGASVPEETAWTSVGLVTTHTVTGLTNETQHTFEVRAVNGRGGGAAAQIQATPGPLPSAPQEFAIAKHSGDVVLSWSTPADDGGSDIVRYEVRHAKGASVPANTAWTGVIRNNIRFDSLESAELYTFVSDG